MKERNILLAMRSKIFSTILIGMMLASSLVVVNYASARHPDVEVKKRSVDAITLSVERKEFADERVRIRVSVLNTKTGERSRETFSKRLNDEGKTNVKIRGLAPDTRYRLTVRIKEANDKNFPSASESEITTTKSIK